MAGDYLDAVAYGARLALQFNPLFSLVGATLAAAIAISVPAGDVRGKATRRLWAFTVIVIAWLIGDGLRVLARTRDIYDGYTILGGPSGALAVDYTVIVVWAVLGIALGYLLPAWTGSYVGRRVTHGTGWLAAGSIAFTTSLALSAVVALAS